jgi:hypothetical protein
MIGQYRIRESALPAVPIPATFTQPRAELRLRSLSWALQGSVVAGLMTLAPSVLPALRSEPGLQAFTPALAAGLELALRAGGCGFFYGLLAFHLQRLDPGDGHLQAGLVGAVCAIRSLALPLELQGGLSTVMMEVLRTWSALWLPVIAAALWLQGVQRCLSSLRP